MERQIKISKKLQKARDYEKAPDQKLGKKPEFHVSAPIGWINDPNGFSEYNGEIHLFFQYNPYDIVWGPMHWGHVKTKDFIKWENMPAALAPDKRYDNFGCFSGSAIEWKGRHVLAYTSVERVKQPDGTFKDYQRQSVAVGDGINYKKIGQNPVITAADIPNGDSELDFRDPKIWVENDMIYMAVANRNADGSGQILIYKTENLKEWEFVNVSDKCENRYGRMWECPDVFRLDGHDILMVSPQEMCGVEGKFHAGDNSIYFIGEYDNEKKFTENYVAAVDYGLDFYAPQTMQTSDGRRIMIAWMQSWSANWFDYEDGFCGMMTIPRELHIENGILKQRPVHELTDYYANEVVINDIIPTKNYEKYEALSGRVQNLDITLEGNDDYRFQIRLAADEKQYSTLTVDKKYGKITFDRSCSGVRRDTAHERSMDILSNKEKITMQLVMDRYSIEVFINEGEQAMSFVIRTPYETDGIYLRADGNVKLAITKHDIVTQ